MIFIKTLKFSLEVVQIFVWCHARSRLMFYVIRDLDSECIQVDSWDDFGKNETIAAIKQFSINFMI